MTPFEIIFASGAAVVAYAVLCRRVNAMAHPLKMRLARLGADLAADARLPIAEKKGIDRALGKVYSSRGAWVMAWSTLIAAAVVAFDALAGKKRRSSDEALPSDLRKKVNNFYLTYLLALASNSPIALVIIFSQLALFIFLYVPVRRLLGKIYEETNKNGGGYLHLRG